MSAESLRTTTSRPRLGRRLYVSGPAATLSVVGGGALYDEPPSYKGHPMSGRGHVAAPTSSSLGIASADELAPAVVTLSPRGRPLSRPTGQHAGGEDHIDFAAGAGADPVEACGLKEAEMRSALEPAARAAAAAVASAGLRVPSRARRSDVPVGGSDSVNRLWDAGGVTTEYKDSVASAQAKLALDPAVQLDAAAVPLAGARVEPRWLGSSIRTRQPSGGVSTLPLRWDGGGAHAAAPPPSSSDGGAAPAALRSPSRAPRPGALVGGFSGKYLAGVAEPAAAPPPPPPPARGQNSRGAASVLSWAGVAAAAGGEPPAAAAAAARPPLLDISASHHEDAPPAGGAAAVPETLPLKPLPRARSGAVMALMIDHSAAGASPGRVSSRRLPPAGAPRLPPFAVSGSEEADAGARARGGRAHVAPSYAAVHVAEPAQQRAQPRHLAASFTFG